MQEINFVKTTIDKYNKRSPIQDDNNVYFIEDTSEIMIGSMKFGNAFIIVDESHPLPAIGRYGYMYLDQTDDFSIKIWDTTSNEYVALPLATSSYIKSIKRVDQSIVGSSGDGREDIAVLDNVLTIEDIDSLFDNN